MRPTNPHPTTNSRPTLQINPPGSQYPQTRPQNVPSNPPPPTEDPQAPPYSPIQASKIASLLTTMSPYNSPSVMAQKPKPVPIAESDNVDVIALRSAISILQLQHLTAEKDIKALQKLKEDALKDPGAYVKELVQRVNQAGGRPLAGPGLMGPTVGNLVAALGPGHELLKTPAAELDLQREDSLLNVPPGSSRGKNAEGDVTMGDDGESSDEDTLAEQSQFQAPPSAQNVYRMPPINWAKYHVVGDALDKLHEDQRRRPVLGQPEESDGRAEPYVMAATYAPVVDAARLNSGQNDTDHPMVTRGAGRKVGSR